MLLCAHFITSHIAEGMVTVNVMVMIATDAWGPVQVGRGTQLTADAEEESKWGETVFDSTVELCNRGSSPSKTIIFFSGGRPNFSMHQNPPKNRQTPNKERPNF